MSRPPRWDQDDVSLFPFLSVLACIIGTLTLMIAALALSEMDNETVVTSEQYEQARRQLADVRTSLAKLRQQTAGDDRRQWELIKARASLAALASQVAAADAEAKDIKKPAPPDVDIKPLEEELARLVKQVEMLAAQVAERKRPPAEAEVVIQPGGSGLDIDPRFVECRADSIVIYSDGEPARIPKSQLASDAAFLDLLDGVAKNRKASVIFLIRDDGIDTYGAAHNVAQAHYAKNAKLPVLGHGKIDLSLFKPKS